MIAPRLPLLVGTAVLCGLAAGLLSACGQKGPLYLPQDEAAAQRATLPQSVFRRNQDGPGDAEAERPAPDPAPQP